MKKIYLLPLTGLILLTYSCRSNDTENNLSGSNLSGISFSLSEGEFDNGDMLVPQASLKAGVNTAEVIRQEAVSGPFNITAELSPNISSIKTQTQASVRKEPMAVNKSLSLRGAVKYRIVAYKADGTYIDQAVGDASQVNQVFFGDQLVKGQTYNFVIYSLGSTVANPPAVPAVNLNSDPTYNFTFLGSYRVDTADLMWAVERNVKILGTPGDTTAPTPLTTPLKHIFTRVDILVDNSDAAGALKGGYLSENTVNATVKSTQLYSASTFNFNTGTIVTGTAYSSGITVSNLNAAAQTYIVNTAGAANSTLSISVPAGAIKVGNDINPNPVTFSFTNAGAGLKPGYSYTLKLRFNSDRYVNASNVTKNVNDSDALYAVIGGYRWDRYNLGVTNLNPAANNPDITTNLPNLNGNFYQWGRIKEFSPSIPVAGDNFPGWDANITGVSENSWNIGSESIPTKNTTNDPCLTGRRVPTDREWTVLINATNASNIGTWLPDSSSYSNPLANSTGSGKVLTSKKATNIKLTFPISGNRSLSVGHLNQRSNRGEYWTSSPVSQGYGKKIYMNEAEIRNSFYSIAEGESIRCIQDK
ncbi:hypothetical protein ATB99_06095 [Elizabethkingia meningoseptica]|uniref:FISUMP domain-containing protein n=1 Tax=Elizabethkingia meningoseptica TaxID=238 RepID=UPI000332CB1E|nr:FISUMP domain-containing protein [Elizabethkingia meningoseptica]AQX05156.1 hypothetical protein BBD33_07815 [Elizabethkingia meningoseptica]AQX47201.1 hypothetical protein B5G46_07805 [Elizabethkingia meningoseptica]EOR29683.1 hypothetical protein L100_10124 [Elizabethkingia meningoseptica ATCC 13253 = NBRC 12535]KUY17824.1 hypothetical protein ATB99_06095 [Elizabethkingia meningoseptica]OPB68486.1 hypothetical protein BAY30_08475 [Elizabethkingia meningoseptica]